ncbi:hypothetical protein T07_9155 [Trichinella nelsoni]|uniref:Uncharacterized protein n=1 Tax=Trichinella nelsoni TaxID=6336 RepID=A0A0V0RCG4_9BILA|nr:hypothetical protein T07_9155 [Trichinella nelsoni]
MDKSKALRKRKESDGQHQAEKLLKLFHFTGQRILHTLISALTDYRFSYILHGSRH